jgi:carbamoyl-phosphate synthase large subunit
VVAARIGYPVLVRPSYVLGGRAMEIVYDEASLDSAMTALFGFDRLAAPDGGSLEREGGLSATRPILIDSFLEDAIEVDVDAVRDATGEILIGGVMEHVEEAGIHSGDSACAIPPPTLPAATVETLVAHTTTIAAALGVRGPINVQFAVKAGEVFVIEANPRASRTVPFVAKATGVPLAKIAARVIVGETLAELRATGLIAPPAPTGGYVSVKEAVLPFARFPEVDALPGPEMRSTGEVMGMAGSFGLAFAKSQIAAGNRLPDGGRIFLSLADRDKPLGLEVAAAFVGLGFVLVATEGTAAFLESNGVPVEAVVGKLTNQKDARRATGDVVALLHEASIQLVVNTPRGRGAHADGAYIRRAASACRVPIVTTVHAARAAAAGISEWRRFGLSVTSLQERHGAVR